MLYYETIHPATLELLKTLMAQQELKDMPQASQEDILEMAQRIGDLRILNRTKSILQMVLKGVKVDVVDYGCYDWIDTPIIKEGLVLASPKDIAALKVNAIEGRGTKKGA